MALTIVGSSKALREALARADRVARTELSVLIRGESGTGKELFAQHIHAASTRAAGPFVAVNCAAIPKDLFESELFGHERGAFTGAHAAKLGAVERARGGTLFLDEIGDMPLDQQAKLLRVLQERVVQRIGGTVAHSVDVRVVAATHRDLLGCPDRFREDLYYRLAGYAIEVPPLRARGDDVIAIANEILAREFPNKRLTRNAKLRLRQHEWRGNVRELGNVVRAAAVDAPGTRIDEAIIAAQPVFASAASARAQRLDSEDRVDVIRGVLSTDGRITAADVRALFRIEHAHACRLLAVWSRDGVLARRGGGRSTFYVLGDVQAVDDELARRRDVTVRAS